MSPSLCLAVVLVGAFLPPVRLQIQNSTTAAETVAMTTTAGTTTAHPPDVTNTTTTCRPDEFLCYSNTCLAAGIVCDNYTDCENNKDENPQFCASWECPMGYERCTNSRQCIRDYLCCDGVRNCRVGTDEDARFCETWECPIGYARCYGSRSCTLEYFFCDEEMDCLIGTDEDPAICKWNDKGQLVYEPYTGNYTDMMSVPCWSGDIRCWPTSCLSACVVCDGYKDCINDFDENPEFCATWECPKGFERCQGDSRQCVHNYLFCDGIDHCDIGTDENVAYCESRTCPVGHKHCYGSRQCVLSYFFTDDENDCTDGTDVLAEWLAMNSTTTTEAPAINMTTTVNA